MRDAADSALQDVLGLALVLGQRPSDTLHLNLRDVDRNRLEIVRGKKGAKLSIKVQGSFKLVLARILSRFRKPGVTQLTVDESGSALTKSVPRRLFDETRKRSGVSFQLRDLRAKNATDADDIFLAQQRLGHTSITTRQKYIRTPKGSAVTPLETPVINDLSGA